MPASLAQEETDLNGLEVLDKSIPVRIMRSKEGRLSGNRAVQETLGMILGGDVYPAWKITAEERGKPYFSEHADAAFSVSDSAGFTAVCFDRTRIGLDLQEHRRRRSDTRDRLFTRCRSIAARAFHEQENACLNEVSDTDRDAFIRRFFRIWSAKEAYVKYTGDGIDDRFSRFSVLPGSRLIFSESVRSVSAAGKRTELTETVPLFEEIGTTAWNALGKWFFCADLYSAEVKLRFSLCICAEVEKPVIFRSG